MRECRSLAALSRDLGIPKSSLHGILQTLEQRSWIRTDMYGRRFALGIRAFRVGAAYLDADDEIDRIRPIVEWLSEKTGETVHLGRLYGADIIYLAKRESRHPLRLFSTIGRCLPAHATALGKAILAEYPEAEVEMVLNWPLERMTSSTITEAGQLYSELEQVRARGFAIDREENSAGICCFAVPVRTEHPVCDAISVSIPIMRLCSETERDIVRLLYESLENVDSATFE